MTTTEYHLLKQEVSGNVVTAQILVPEDLYYFDGHFDEIPVLPGVVQLNWAMELAIKHFALGGDFQAIDTMKFTKIIPPGTMLDLRIEYLPEKAKLLFAYQLGEQTYSYGKIQVS